MTVLRIADEELRELFVGQLAVIDAPDFERARIAAGRARVPLSRLLTERGHVPADFLMEQIASAWGVGCAKLDVSEVDGAALRTIREDFARGHNVVAFACAEGALKVAMTDPRDRRLIEELERDTGAAVTPYLASHRAIQRAHLLYRGDLRASLDPLVARAAALQATDDGGAVELLTRLLEHAALVGASDIHIEPYELEAIVRCRVDGVLQEIASMPPRAVIPLVARVKVLSGLRMDERRSPQDGRFQTNLGGLEFDYRVSSLPTLWGEKLVLRVLGRNTATFDLEDLGLTGGQFDAFSRAIRRPHGMILITGPTGSGKTTTLYGAVARLFVERQGQINLSTVEDPVEYTIPRVNQVPINPAAGIDFASGLRALLRQDPDAIMVGEIRDLETAEIAVRAALVGRLLLSTLHTNDATAAVPRLMDMGVEPFLVASTLSLVVAQRLVRRICARCRESVELDPRVRTLLQSRPDFEAILCRLREDGALAPGASLDRVRLFRGLGCAACGMSGYQGRIGIFEVFEPDDTSRAIVAERSGATALRAHAIAGGMRTLFENGLAKALVGETTLDEVLRVAV